MALAFLVNLLTARYLGPSNYGLVNYAALYTAFFTSFATLGLSSLLLKDFMDDPEGAGTTVGTAIAMRLLSSTLSAVSILAIVAAVDRGERLTMTVVALYSMSLIFQAFDTIQYWFQSRLESKYATIATSVGYIIVSFYKVLLLVLGKDVRWFAISNTIDYAVAAIVFLGLYKWRGGPRLHISPAKGRALLRQSGSFILCGLMVSVYNCTDRFMLKHLLDEASVGYYATATSLATVWTFVLSAIIDSITPGIMQAHRTDRAQFVRHNRQLYALVFYLSVAVSAVITLLARPAVSLLYGEAYLPAVMPMQVITWYTAFSYLCGRGPRRVGGMRRKAKVSDTALYRLRVGECGSEFSADSLLGRNRCCRCLPADANIYNVRISASPTSAASQWAADVSGNPAA